MTLRASWKFYSAIIWDGTLDFRPALPRSRRICSHVRAAQEMANDARRAMAFHGTGRRRGGARLKLSRGFLAETGLGAATKSWRARGGLRGWVLTSWWRRALQPRPVNGNWR